MATNGQPGEDAEQKKQRERKTAGSLIRHTNVRKIGRIIAIVFWIALGFRIFYTLVELLLLFFETRSYIL